MKLFPTIQRATVIYSGMVKLQNVNLLIKRSGLRLLSFTLPKLLFFLIFLFFYFFTAHEFTTSIVVHTTNKKKKIKRKIKTEHKIVQLAAIVNSPHGREHPRRISWAMLDDLTSFGPTGSHGGWSPS